MKHIYGYFTIGTLILILAAHQAFSWGIDKVISNFATSAQHSMAAKQNGVLYAAMTGVGIMGPNLVSVYMSTDNGDTWNLSPVQGLPATGPVVKTKMVVTGSDSIYCLFLQNNSVKIFNVESGVLGQLTQISCKDFDAAGSPNGNWIYVWGSNNTNDNINRYGTEDGGVTWNGNTALVTGNGACPRITLSGTRLILNYYGPVLPDTATSVIRAAFYDETAPGTLAAGTFQDVALNTGVRRKQFKTVLVNGTAWFVFTEGDAQQVIKCRVTQDDGVTYQPEFTIVGNPSVNYWWFDLASYSTPAVTGMTMTCLADSSAPVIPSFNKMLFLGSSILTPGGVVVFPAPYNTFNDTSVTFAAANAVPVVVNTNAGLTSESCIAWVGDSPQGPWLYFDRRDATVGLHDDQDFAAAISVYPAPASEFIYIESKELQTGKVTVELYDLSGRRALGKFVSFNDGPLMIDISALPSGNYLLQVSSPERKYFRKKIQVL